MTLVAISSQKNAFLAVTQTNFGKVSSGAARIRQM